MFCFNCGKQLPDGIRYCTSCGSLIDGLSSHEHSTQDEPYYSTIRQEPDDATARIFHQPTPMPTDMVTQPGNSGFFPQAHVFSQATWQPGKPEFRKKDSIAISIVIPISFLAVISVLFTFIIFIIIDMSPPDPVTFPLGSDSTEEEYEEIREESGSSNPFLVRYGRFITGKYGESLMTRSSVSDSIKERILTTIILVSASLIISYAIAVPLGLLSARNLGSVTDEICNVISIISRATPFFFIAMMLGLVFSVHLKWLPIAGLQRWTGYILPILTLVISYVGYAVQTVRATAACVISSDITSIFFQEQHDEEASNGTKNRISMLPSISKSGVQLGWLMIGVIMTEITFAIPGVGSFLMSGVIYRDTTVLYGSIMALYAIFLIASAVFFAIICAVVIAMRTKPGKWLEVRL